MKYFKSYECEICGKRKGGGIDHSKCSKIKQQQNTTKAKKPASDKRLEVLADACRKYGW